jgi:hypothetical protein
MASLKKFRPRAATAGQPVTEADSGITWASLARPRCVEYKTGELHRTVITVPELSFTTTAAAKGIGQGIYEFPEGWILPVAARVKTVTTTGGTTSATAGEIGLGTTVASGAVAVLSGTAGFENILTGQTIDNHVAVTPLTVHNAATAGGTSGTTNLLDGTTTPVQVHLNIASTYSGTGGVTLNSAEVEILWVWMGDK